MTKNRYYIVQKPPFSLLKGSGCFVSLGLGISIVGPVISLHTDRPPTADTIVQFFNDPTECNRKKIKRETHIYINLRLSNTNQKAYTHKNVLKTTDTPRMASTFNTSRKVLVNLNAFPLSSILFDRTKKSI